MFSIHAMGNLMRQLNQVRMGFFALRRLARDLGTEFEETGRRGTNSMRNIEAVIRQNAMMAFGQMTTMLGQRVNRRIFEFGQGFLEAGANMESVRVQFEQIFGSDQASDRLNETLRLASLTILDTDQALEGVARFSRMGADVLSDAFQVNVGTIDQPVMRAVSGLQLISDLVIATGQTQENVMFNMAGAIRGQTRSWRGLFDGMVDAEEEGFNQAATAGERAQIILGTIAREFGGISARAEGTMQFMLRNLRDILRSIQMIVGERLLGVFRPLVERLTVLLRAFRENEQFIEAFTFVIQGPMRILASIGGKILDMVEAVERFIVQRPRLARLVATFATIVPIVLIVVGSMATLAASFSFFTVFVLPGLMAFLGSIGGSFMLLIGPLRWLVLAFAALVAAYRHNLGGFRDWVEDVVLGIQGVLQVFRTYRSGVARMSTEMEDRLRAAGIFHFVAQIGLWLGHIKQIFIDLWAFMRSDTVREIFRPLGESIGELIHVVGDLFSGLGRGLIGPLDELRTAPVDVSQWEGLRIVLEAISKGLMGVTEFLADLFGRIRWEGVGDFFQGLWRIIRLLINALPAIFSMIISGVRVIGSVFVVVWNLILGIVDAFSLFFQQVTNIGRSTDRVGTGMREFTGEGQIGINRLAERLQTFAERMDEIASPENMAGLRERLATFIGIFLTTIVNLMAFFTDHMELRIRLFIFRLGEQIREQLRIQLPTIIPSPRRVREGVERIQEERRGRRMGEREQEFEERLGVDIESLREFHMDPEFLRLIQNVSDVIRVPEPGTVPRYRPQLAMEEIIMNSLGRQLRVQEEIARNTDPNRQTLPTTINFMGVDVSVPVGPYGQVNM